MKATLAFDVYGTLVDPLGIAETLRGFVGDRAAAFAQAWREKQLEYTFRRGLMRRYRDFDVCTREALGHVDARFGTRLSPAAVDALMARYLELPAYGDAVEAVSNLRELGHRVYAFSNGRPDQLLQLLQFAGLLDLLDGVVSVDPVASFKPDPAVYRHFLEAAESAATDTWLVSGNPFDVIGARSAGWNAAWIRRDPAAVFDPWGIEPTLTVTSLRALVTALPTLA
jgi:2-haloacid dehalogenase